MDGLKALLAKKRKAADEEFGGRTQVKRIDIEQARIKQLRNEEQNELGVKVVCSLHIGTGIHIIMVHTHWNSYYHMVHTHCTHCSCAGSKACKQERSRWQRGTAKT